MVGLEVICLLALAAGTRALTECETQYYQGSCHSMFGSCESGQKMSFSHCGFLKKCCYNENKPQGTQAPLTSSEQCGHRLVASDDRIIGGKSALSGEYPWQVSLRYQGQHMCGGTLIDRQWVLTAAHCFEQYSDLDSFDDIRRPPTGRTGPPVLAGTYVNGWTAAIGITDLRNLYSSQVYSASDIITHGSFDSTSNSHDIALMKLSKPVDISGKASRTACLPDFTEDFNNVVCTVSGWGSTRFDGPGSRYLNQVSIPVMSNSLCSYYLGNVVYDHNICAGINAGGRDACQGDSGGPLVCQTGGSWKIAGIVSWGYGCGDKNTPGVYTRVSSFLDWIKQVQQGYP